MNIKEIKELVKMLDGTDISELTFESEGNRIVIKKGIGGIPYLSPQISPMMQFPWCRMYRQRFPTFHHQASRR